MKNSDDAPKSSAAPNAKYCPQCARLCPLTAQTCRACGHQFRTNFAAPAARKERLSLRVRLQNFVLDARRWQAAHQAQLEAAKGPLGWAAMVIIGILLLVHPFGVASKSPAPGVPPAQADTPKAAPPSKPAPAAHASPGKSRSQTGGRRARKMRRR